MYTIMMSKETFCYFLGMVTGFIQHVFLITQKHLTTENPTSANSYWQNSQSIFTHEPGKIPTTSRSYQAKTNALISPGKVLDLMMKRYVSHVNKRVK